MPDNILDSISRHYNSMTQTAKKLADYIFSNKAMVQYMSITSLAEASHVSEASITRFCRTLNLSGYNELKLALARSVQAENGPPPDAESLANEDGIRNLCNRLYQINVTALSETLELLNSEQVRRAVSLLSNASRVFCFGQGGSNITAMEAWARFSWVSPQFLHIEDSHMQATAAALCSPNDVILFFSYSGSTRDMLDCLKPAKQNGAKIILITHFSNSPAAMMSDVILLCGSNETPLQSGSIAAKISQMFIIDYLYHAYCAQNADLCSKNQEATAQVTARKLL